MHRRTLLCVAFAALCGTRLSLAAQSFRITGEVTDSIHRTPLSDATVLAAPVAPTRDTVFHATRSDAKYRACGLPVGAPLLVQAQSGAREQSGVVEERIGAAGVLVRELVLGVTARGSTLASGADTNAVHGAGVVRGVVLSR